MAMTSGIYCIRNVISGKRYIGSAISVSYRWHGHKSDLRRNKHHSPHLQCAWSQYGENNFEWTILEECSVEMLTIREQAWMNYYHSYDGNFGYNICPTAGSCLGCKHSEEHNHKIGLALKGKKKSEEHNLKNSVAQKGRKMSEERKQGMRDGWKKHYEKLRASSAQSTEKSK
jgi:group I intron endonuclease